MNFNQLTKEIYKREGKRQQVNITQIGEIIKCIDEIMKEDSEHFAINLKHSFNKWKVVKPRRKKRK